MAVLNFFPVKTVVDGKTWRACKVDTREGLVRVWVVDERRPKLLGAWPESDIVLSNGRGEIATGPNITFLKAGGCGCAHPLKRFVPPVGLEGVERVAL